jgi:adenosylhomocysteine nucleosidase
MSHPERDASAPRHSFNGLTAIVAAMPEELAALEFRVNPTRRHRLGSCDALRGTLDGHDVVLATTGDGPKRAEAGIRSLFDELQIARLLVAGISGGLSQALQPGAVVVAREVRHRYEVAPAPDADWLRFALERREIEGAVLLTADRILSTAASKAQARELLSTAEPSAVDIETALYARVAAERGIPYLVLRVICDTANEDLPLDLNECLDESGGVSRVKVMQHAMRHPSLMGKLLALRKRVNQAAEALALHVPQMLKGPAS